MEHILEYKEYNDDIYIEFINAIKKCDTEAVEMMLNSDDVDPGAHDSLALSQAADNGCADIIKLLLADSRVNINSKESKAIRYAALGNHREAVELLMNHDMHVEAYPQVLIAARWNKWLNVIDYLIQDEAGFNYIKMLRSSDTDDVYTNALKRYFDVEDDESLDTLIKMTSE